MMAQEDQNSAGIIMRCINYVYEKGKNHPYAAIGLAAIVGAAAGGVILGVVTDDNVVGVIFGTAGGAVAGGIACSIFSTLLCQNSHRVQEEEEPILSVGGSTI